MIIAITGHYGLKQVLALKWYLGPELVDMNCLPKPNESLIIYQYGIWDEGPRVNASKSLGREIIAAIINVFLRRR